MNLKNIIVYKNDTLFNILDEIKDEFNFRLAKFDQKKHSEEKKDFLVITNEEKNTFKNQLILKDLPIKIDKLLEEINLKLLKEKFNYQSDISIGSYKINLNSREISKDNKILGLTEREINLIIFLKNSDVAVKINDLQKNVWEYNPELETHTVETHIYRLRKKIKENFNDDKFIISSKKGYIINEKKK